MAGRQLIVTVKAEDQASGAVRGITNTIINLGGASVKTDRALASAAASVTRAWSGIKTVVGGAVAYVTGRAVVDAFNAQAKILDEVGKKARQYGMSVEQLSAIKYGADLANVSFETVASALSKANQKLGEFATTGKSKAKDAFRELGISVKDAKKDITELLPMMADALNQMPVAKREYIAAKIFGGNGPEFVRFLAEGSERLREYMVEARKLGAIYSSEETKKANEYLDAVTRIQYAWGGLKTRLVTDVAPALTDISNKLASVIASVPEMWKSLTADISSAKSGDADAGERLYKLGASLIETSVVITKGIARVATPAASIALTEIFFMIGARTEAWARTLPERVGLAVAEGANEASLKIGEYLVPALGAAMPGLAPLLLIEQARVENRIKGIQTARQALDQQERSLTQSIADRDKLLKQSLTGSDYPEFAKIVGEVTGEISSSTQAFLDNADAVMKWREAIAARQVGNLDARPITPTPDPQAAQEWDDFFGGISDGYDELARKAADYRTQGEYYFTSIADAAINNLGNAMTEVQNDWRSAGDAAKQWANNTLLAIQQVTNQLIAMRIVTAALGGLGSFFGGAGGVDYGTATRSVGAEFATAYGAKGGGVWAHGIQRFGRGGYVHGPDVARDIVPALLMPGEGVVNRRGMGVLGMGDLARVNRGETPQSGGGSIVINQTFNITGGGNNVDGVKAAARQGADEIVRMFERSPRARDSFKRVMS